MKQNVMTGILVEMPDLVIRGMSSRLPESCAQKNRFFNCRDQLCVNLDTGELIQFMSYWHDLIFAWLCRPFLGYSFPAYPICA